MKHGPEMVFDFKYLVLQPDGVDHIQHLPKLAEALCDILYLLALNELEGLVIIAEVESTLLDCFTMPLALVVLLAFCMKVESRLNCI